MTYYDSISEGYTELHQEEQLKKISILKEHLYIKPKSFLLDIGCGPYFADFPCKTFGIDPSIGLLQYAKIPSVCAVSEHLPFKDSSFDTVTSITAIQNFTDIEKALLEAKRVCKGQFAITVLKRSPKLATIEKLMNKHFDIQEKIEEEKDMIFIAKYK
jgi:ubiquinone/menaquinone biosynthesis C-methylase UbiE